MNMIGNRIVRRATSVARDYVYLYPFPAVKFELLASESYQLSKDCFWEVPFATDFYVPEFAQDALGNQ